MIQNGKHGPSIHCSYYACLQTLLHILSCNMSKDQINEIVNSQNSHIKILHEVTFGKKTVLEEKTKGQIGSLFGNLKKTRKKADYQGIEILAKHSNKAKEQSEKILSLIKSAYNL